MISVVVPVCNERDNVAPLAREIQAVLAVRGPFEIVFVDDGSTDGTAAAALGARASGLPQLRLLRHEHIDVSALIEARRSREEPVLLRPHVPERRETVAAAP